VGYQFRCMARYLPVRPSELGGGNIGCGLVPIMLLLKASCAVGSAFFQRLEMRAKYQRRGHPKNYVAIVSKIAP